MAGTRPVDPVREGAVAGGERVVRHPVAGPAEAVPSGAQAVPGWAKVRRIGLVLVAAARVAAEPLVPGIARPVPVLGGRGPAGDRVLVRGAQAVAAGGCTARRGCAWPARARHRLARAGRAGQLGARR